MHPTVGKRVGVTQNDKFVSVTRKDGKAGIGYSEGRYAKMASKLISYWLLVFNAQSALYFIIRANAKMEKTVGQ